MREILFRGKRLDNGEWITGQLLNFEDGRARICERGTDIFCFEKDESIIQTIAHRVDPKTVGQYTGFVDKNGNRIFEGDIIKHIVTSDTRWEAIVKWDNDGARFLGLIIGNEPRIMYVGMIDKNNKSVVAVIGNIYDNPELLKDGALNDD